MRNLRSDVRVQLRLEEPPGSDGENGQQYSHGHHASIDGLVWNHDWGTCPVDFASALTATATVDIILQENAKRTIA